MKYLSLFTGIGGFELGIQRAAKKLNKTVECVGFSEINRPSIQIYDYHFPTHQNFGDITKIDAKSLPDFDFLCGGFPCQSFSFAGARRGFEDTRGTLFFDIARILGDKRPKFFLLENVKGLLHHDDGKTFSIIIHALGDLGYDVQWQVLNSQHFNVPQNRQRVYIVGHLRGESRPQIFPIIPAGSQIIAQEENGVCAATLTASGCADIGKTGVNTIFVDLNTFVNRRPKTSQICFPTLSTKQNELGVSVNGRIRVLTPLECEKLQGFPAFWTKYGACKQKELVWNGKININSAGQRAPRMISAPKDGRYKMVDSTRYNTLGNAVTVNVIEHIMGGILHVQFTHSSRTVGGG